jgi:hypothetical protein
LSDGTPVGSGCQQTFVEKIYVDDRGDWNLARNGG